MELIKLEDLNISNGAPAPIILSDDRKLIVLFRTDPINTLLSPELGGTEMCKIEFLRPQLFKFGLPNNETIQGHPYYKLGLRSYHFFEVKDSQWIKELRYVQSIHPNFNENSWQRVRHFIVTFHDNIFECLALDYSTFFLNEELHSEASALIERTHELE